MTTKSKWTCFNCGQDITETHLCTRCNNICKMCGEIRKEHLVVGTMEFCPTVVFHPSGELKE